MQTRAALVVAAAVAIGMAFFYSAKKTNAPEPRIPTSASSAPQGETALLREPSFTADEAEPPSPIAAAEKRRPAADRPGASNTTSPDTNTSPSIPEAPRLAERPAAPVSADVSALESDLLQVQLMVRRFRDAVGENPIGTNAEIMAAVLGDNSRQTRIGPPENQHLNENGELVDRWGTPYFFHQLSKTRMEIRSAGPDRTMWTADDQQL